MHAKKLIELNQTDRNFWVFDTYEGMPEPDVLDKNFKQTSAQHLMNEEEKEKSLTWAYSNYEGNHRKYLKYGIS